MGIISKDLVDELISDSVSHVVETWQEKLMWEKTL